MPGPDLEEHRVALFSFTERLLKDYTSELCSRPGPSDQKEFNDPIWQTIVVQPFEVALLDSPLLQRLRMIRQLGVVHWVYPGATHTRFEHTLGVIHQVQNLITAINKRSAEQGEAAVINEETENLMRLIALCHDIGHGAMSHVSENALRNSKRMEDILNQFAEKVHIERAKPSELAAYYMVDSPAFKALLGVVQERNPHHKLPNNPILSVKRAIVGQQISDKVPLLHELISGPFDADKLDYMPRDARMAGVPVVTDIPRLIQKVRATKVRQSQLPKKVARGVEGGLSEYVMTGIALSGGRTLDELMFGRTLLFDKIYRHQKVRAAESMVAALLDGLVKITLGSSEMLPYRFVDDQLINFDEQAIKSLTGRKPKGRKAEYARIVTDISRRLRERRLFVRAFAFSRHMPLDPYSNDPQQAAGLDRLIRHATNPQRRRELVNNIAIETERLLRILEKDDLLGAFSGEALRSYIWVDPPEATSRTGDIANAYLIGPSGELLPFKEETAEAPAWTDAYLLARDLGYVFTTLELSPYVFLATEREVRASYNVKMPQSMVSHIKQSKKLIDDLRRELAAKRYYDNLSFDLQPIPRRLMNADVGNRLNEMAERLRAYEGPYVDVSGENREEVVRLSQERIRDWLRQFPFIDDDFIGAALDMLDMVRLIGRRDIGRSVTKFLEENQAFSEATVCPLGEPKDSSSICTYQAADVQDDYSFKIVSLTDALASPGNRPVLFVDDFIGSGKQSVDILEHLLGEEPTYNLGETRQTLSEALRKILRERQLGFLFAAGMDEGLKLLRERTKSLGLSAIVAVTIRENELPFAFPEGNLSAAQTALREECRKIGRALLDDGDSRHTPEWIEKRALGYGNRSLLVVFPYNTPSQSLTCLWKEGTVGARRWSPLFPRRKKK